MAHRVVAGCGSPHFAVMPRAFTSFHVSLAMRGGAQVGDVADGLVGGDGAGEVARTRSGLGFAFGSGIVVRFLTLGVQPRIPSSRISLRTLYRLRPENSAGKKHFTNRKPNLRSDSSNTRRTASSSPARPSAPWKGDRDSSWCCLSTGDDVAMIWQGAASANRSRPALHQLFAAAARKASSALPMMTLRARTRAASKERIMAMQIDETEPEDMRDDALALAKGCA